jgi:GDPmannose 4,6-dehydratase
MHSVLYRLSNYIEISEKYFRPTEVEELLGDSTQARHELLWSPKYSLMKSI